jgi:RNA polymerase sigma factor (TIGR02999 family)
MSASTTPVTELLLAWRQGDKTALDELLPLVYAELRRVAHRFMLRERRGHTLRTTALVNEAYLRLAGSRLVHWRDRAHFVAICAQLMRRILVDYARSHRSAKRAGQQTCVQLDDALASFEAKSRDLVALDDALTTLATLDPEKARLIELRFFGGLSMAEAAEVLGVTEDAARWNWRLARAWLARQMGSMVAHAL